MKLIWYFIYLFFAQDYQSKYNKIILIIKVDIDYNIIHKWILISKIFLLINVYKK